MYNSFMVEKGPSRMGQVLRAPLKVPGIIRGLVQDAKEISPFRKRDHLDEVVDRISRGK